MILLHHLTTVTLLAYLVVTVFARSGGTVLGDRENVVGILSGYNQIVTSSTLRWVVASDGAVPENAVIGAHRFRTAKENNNGAGGEEEVEEDRVKQPVWVCRARASGMWVSGRLSTADEQNSGQCTVSMHGAVSYHHVYEVLQNIEDGGKLSWARWDKYNLLPAGAVTGGPEPYLTYVARRKTSEPDSIATYQLGKLDPARGLMGKISIVEDDGYVREYEDGEVLIETEPIKYEMDRVKFNMWRARFYRERIELGSATLRNEGDLIQNEDNSEVSRVDTVIAYRHNNTISWGHGHGILTGLPVNIRLANGTQMDPFKWAIDATTSHESTYQVETFLQPGRAVNVTLAANWTESNIPYTATVIAVYADGTKKSRTFAGSKREVGIRDVRTDFGPVYFLHNNSHVPTTTTTTTSTTTTTTTSTTLRTTTLTSSRGTSTSTTEARPIPPSPMEEKPIITKKGTPLSDNAKGENQSMMSDGPPRAEPKSTGTKMIPFSISFLTLLISLVFST